MSNQIPNPPIPAEWLPQAAQRITVVCAASEYDDTVIHLDVARDWKERGEPYLRRVGDIDDDARIVAVFPGHLTSTLGAAVQHYPAT